ncbi:MAG: PAS domain S-box protein, partial [Deltaproteobacteria bacterium]
MNRHFDPEIEKRIAAEVERRTAEISERPADCELTAVRLREELARTKADLKTNIEEQETANEELRVTNEELETAYEELRVTNEQLENWNAFAHAPVGLVITDPEGRFLQANEAYCRLLGYQEQELLRLDFKQLTHPDDLKGNLAEFDRLLAGEISAFFIEKRDLRKDGTSVWVRASANVQRDAEGRPSRIIGIVEDIDERRRAEAALRESESRFRMVLENSLDAAYRRNLRIDRYDYVSPVIEQMTGYKAKDFIQLKLEGVLARIHPDDVDRVRREVERILAGEKAIGQADYRFKSKNGNYRWLSDRYQVLRDDAGRPLYRLGIIRDITEAKQKEQELLQLTEELTRSNRELEQFAYIASHDLQTPLRSITGFLDLLSRRYHGRLGTDADEFISYAVEGAERMHQLINDILAFSRVGSTGNPLEDMDAREPLQKALGNLQTEITGSVPLLARVPEIRPRAGAVDHQKD